MGLSCDLTGPWCDVAHGLAALSGGCFLVTLFQIVQNARLQSTCLSFSLGILYVQLLQTICMVGHYILLVDRYTFLFLLMEYFQILFDTIVYSYFADEAAKATYYYSLKRLVWVLLVAFNLVLATGFAAYVVTGDVLEGRELYECNNPIWLYLKVPGLVLTVGFIGVGVVLTRSVLFVRSVNEHVVDLGKLKELW